MVHVNPIVVLLTIFFILVNSAGGTASFLIVTRKTPLTMCPSVANLKTRCKQEGGPNTMTHFETCLLGAASNHFLLCIVAFVGVTI